MEYAANHSAVGAHAIRGMLIGVGSSCCCEVVMQWPPTPHAANTQELPITWATRCSLYYELFSCNTVYCRHKVCRVLFKRQKFIVV